MPRLDLSHQRGNHCGSTALRNIARYYDWGFDEALCFGLGSGLGFSYQRVQERPERMFFGRTSDLETQFFDTLSIPVTVREGDSFDTTWTDMRAYLDAGHPVLIFTDLFYLDYYNSSTHFSPHSLLLVGYGDDTAHLADSEFAEIQRLPLERLEAAMTSKHMSPLQCRYLVVDSPVIGRSFSTAVQLALERTATYMLDPEAVIEPDATYGTQGIAGIRAMAADLPTWNQLTDPSWTVRFAYQNIERRGTGGGAFRAMFGNFLDQVHESVPIPADPPAEMARIADAWTAVSETLYEASETDDVARFHRLLDEAASDVSAIADAEESLFTVIGDSL